MKTTIQISNETLLLLQGLKKRLNADSYDSVINSIVFKENKGKSLGGFLGQRNKKELKKDLRDENDRF